MTDLNKLPWYNMDCQGSQSFARKVMDVPTVVFQMEKPVHRRWWSSNFIFRLISVILYIPVGIIVLMYYFVAMVMLLLIHIFGHAIDFLFFEAKRQKKFEEERRSRTCH